MSMTQISAIVKDLPSGWIVGGVVCEGSIMFEARKGGRRVYAGRVETLVRRCLQADGQADLFGDDQEDAKAKRDRAIAQVDEHANEAWKAQAFEAVQVAARELATLTTDDVWRVLARDQAGPQTHEPRALGPIMLRAQREGIISPTDGFRLSKRSAAHASPKRVWLSNVHGVPIY